MTQRDARLSGAPPPLLIVCVYVRNLCIFATRIPNVHLPVNRQKLKRQPCMRKSGVGGNRHSNGAHSLPRERSRPERGFSPAHTLVMFKPIIQERRHVNTTYFPSNGGAGGGETKTLAIIFFFYREDEKRAVCAIWSLD